MILGPKKLIELVNKNNLVEDLSERELVNPEGSGFDLRISEAFVISGEGFLGVTHRSTPKVLLVASYKKQKGIKASLVVKPGEFYLIKTIEKVNMPEDLTASITPRSTTYRSGLFIRSGNVPPGYHGELMFGLKNEGKAIVTIEMGARIVHIQFARVEGGGFVYRGQWQGGRIAAIKKEKQI